MYEYLKQLEVEISIASNDPDLSKYDEKPIIRTSRRLTRSTFAGRISADINVQFRPTKIKVLDSLIPLFSEPIEYEPFLRYNVQNFQIVDDKTIPETNET